MALCFPGGEEYGEATFDSEGPRRVAPRRPLMCKGDGTMSASSLSGFTISTSFVRNRAVLAVQGEVNLVTAPELADIQDAVIDGGHRSVVLDLAELDSMDVSGVGVIVRGVRRLKPLGGVLTVRSPSASVRRLLDLSGATNLVSLEEPESGLGPVGREQPIGPSRAPTAERDELAQHLRTATTLHADHDVVDGALRLVVALARATVGGADGVSVSLRRHGQLATVAASDQTITEMDTDQYATGQGPCVDASVEGSWFHVESLDTEDRWPAFTPRARALGINAILSSPLQTRDKPVGALNIYSRTAAAFAPADQQLAALFATEASTILTHAGLDVTDEQDAGRVGEALAARQAIAHAQGVLMERGALSEDAAYAALRRMSVTSGMPLRQEAERVVASTRPSRPESDAAPLRELHD